MRRSVVCLVVGAFLLSFVSLSFSAGGGDITFEVKGAEPVHFSHDYHLKLRGLKCAACHFQKFAKGATYEMKKESITKRDFCIHCHNGLKGFDVDSEKNCIRCHSKK